MEVIYRLISSTEMEIYDVNSHGTLSFRRTKKIKEKELRKARNLLIGPNFSNWDSVKFKNPDYQPQKDTFIFENRSVVSLKNIIYSKPIFDKKRGTWSQAWVLLPRLKSVFPTFNPMGKTIFIEGYCITPSEGQLSWTSNKINLTFQVDLSHCTIASRSSELATSEGNINGFQIDRSKSLIFKHKQGLSLLLASALCLMLSGVVTWNFTFNQLWNYHHYEPLTFDNSIDLLATVGSLQKFIPNGSLAEISFNNSLGNTSLKFKDLLSLKTFIEESQVESKFRVESTGTTLILFKE